MNQTSIVNSTATLTSGGNREQFCRPAGWIDVLKFFLFNYFLHGVTVLPLPGSGIWLTAFRSFAAILLPFSGVSRALAIIFRYARGNDLEIAAKAGALCMAAKSEDVERFGLLVSIISSLKKLIKTNMIQGEDIAFNDACAWPAPFWKGTGQLATTLRDLKMEFTRN